MRERTDLEARIMAIGALERELEDADVLIGLGEAEGDQSSVEELSLIHI